MRRTVALVVMATVLAGCGVPTDSQPRDIAERRIPFDLLEPSTTTSTSQAQVAAEVVAVYMVVGEKVAPVPREVMSPAVLSRVIATLLRGPSTDESSRGIRTAVPNDTQLLSARLENGVATIDLSRELASVSGQEQILALAQIVFTAVEVPGVTSVRFALDDKPVEVPRGDGTLTTDALQGRDYASLRSPIG